MTTVADGWDPDTASREISALRTLVGPDAPVGAYLRIDAPGDGRADSLHDVDELHLYHLGLVGDDDLERAREWLHGPS